MEGGGYGGEWRVGSAWQSHAEHGGRGAAGGGCTALVCTPPAHNERLECVGGPQTDDDELADDVSILISTSRPEAAAAATHPTQANPSTFDDLPSKTGQQM